MLDESRILPLQDTKVLSESLTMDGLRMLCKLRGQAQSGTREVLVELISGRPAQDFEQRRNAYVEYARGVVRVGEGPTMEKRREWSVQVQSWLAAKKLPRSQLESFCEHYGVSSDGTVEDLHKRMAAFSVRLVCQEREPEERLSEILSAKDRHKDAKGKDDGSILS